MGENRANSGVRSVLSLQGKQQSWLLKLSRFLKGQKVWAVEPHPSAMKKTKGGHCCEQVIEEIAPKVPITPFLFRQRRVAILLFRHVVFFFFCATLDDA